MLPTHIKVDHLSENQLLEWGFTKNEAGHWQLFKRLSIEGLELRIIIAEQILMYQVYDAHFKDLWLPFYQKDNETAIMIEVSNILEQFMPRNKGIYDKIIAIVKEQCDDVILEKPWEKSPNFTTFKVGKNKKWFALYMDIEADRLGLEHTMLIDVLNIKLPPELIEQLIDYQIYFPAYHMNKKHWLSIYLNQATDQEALCALISKSYFLVKGRSK